LVGKDYHRGECGEVGEPTINKVSLSILIIFMIIIIIIIIPVTFHLFSAPFLRPLFNPQLS
jgi:hypothetical protein